MWNSTTGREKKKEKTKLYKNGREKEREREIEGLHVSDNGVMKEGGNIIHVHIFVV